MKFMIVDNNKRFRKYLCDFILSENDYCVELDDVENIHSTYKQFRPDWVLLDINMKKVNGFEAAEKLLEDFPDAKFIIVSNYTDEPYRAKAEKVGARAFVSKENLFELYDIVHASDS